jgi:hypothetical protein
MHVLRTFRPSAFAGCAEALVLHPQRCEVTAGFHISNQMTGFTVSTADRADCWSNSTALPDATANVMH